MCFPFEILPQIAQSMISTIRAFNIPFMWIVRFIVCQSATLWAEHSIRTVWVKSAVAFPTSNLFYKLSVDIRSAHNYSFLPLSLPGMISIYIRLLYLKISILSKPPPAIWTIDDAVRCISFLPPANPVPMQITHPLYRVHCISWPWIKFLQCITCVFFYHF